MKIQNFNCPLCNFENSNKYSADKDREYWLCANCSLIYVPRDQLISIEAEEQRYSFHQSDEGYESYLGSIAKKIDEKISRNSFGLDFGCGQTTILENILTGRGHKINSYDVFFHPDEAVFQNKYDFIILSEVIEHLREPNKVLLRLSHLLNSDGKIFIKTKCHPRDLALFDKWFYKRDSTHIQFFSLETFLWMKSNFEFQTFQEIGDDLYLLAY